MPLNKETKPNQTETKPKTQEPNVTVHHQHEYIDYVALISLGE